MEDLKLTVQILCPNGEDPVLCRCSIEAAIAGLDAEVIITEQFSKDVRGEYVLLVHPDVVVGEESIRTLCFFMDEHPDAGLVGMKLINRQGVYLSESRRYFPSWKTRLFKSKQFYPDTGNDKVMKVDLPSGKIRMARREVLDELNDEVGLALRMKEKGLVNYYLPEPVLCLNTPVKQSKPKNRRLLVICREKDFERIKKTAVRRMPELQYVNLWDLDEERVMDAICRRNQMKGFTDIALVVPEIRFEQFLLFIQRMPNKHTVYHVFVAEDERLVSLD